MIQPRRVLLGAFAAFHVGMGLLWVLQPALRESSPALVVLRGLGGRVDAANPMLAWGLAYLLAACCLLAAQTGSVWLGWVGFEVGGTVTGFYAGCLLVNAVQTPAQSFTGPLVYGMVAWLHGVAALSQRR